DLGLTQPATYRKPHSTDTSSKALRSLHGADETPADAATAAPGQGTLASRSRLGASTFAGFVYLPKLTFTITDHLEEILRQLNGLLLGVRPEDREAADHLFPLSERSIRPAPLPVRGPNARAESAWQAALSGNQPTSLHPLFDQLPHFVHFLL